LTALLTLGFDKRSTTVSYADGLKQWVKTHITSCPAMNMQWIPISSLSAFHLLVSSVAAASFSSCSQCATAG